MMMGQRENEEMRLAIQQKYGFDQPIHKQYLYYLNDLSPISLHSNNTNDFNNINNHMYNIFASFSITEFDLVSKEDMQPLAELVEQFLQDRDNVLLKVGGAHKAGAGAQSRTAPIGA